VSALWQGLPTLPPGRPNVSEPNVRPETFGQVTAGSGDHCGEHLQEVEITLENKGFLELRRL
jgi:hypothetical protein